MLHSLQKRKRILELLKLRFYRRGWNSQSLRVNTERFGHPHLKHILDESDLFGCISFIKLVLENKSSAFAYFSLGYCQVLQQFTEMTSRYAQEMQAVS